MSSHEPATPRQTSSDVDEQREETAAAGMAGPTPSMPAIPEPMTRGALRGAAIGGLIGAVVLSPASAIAFGGLDFVVRLVIVLIIGAVAGSAAGAVFFGGAVAETENPESAGDESVVPDSMHRQRH